MIKTITVAQLNDKLKQFLLQFITQEFYWELSFTSMSNNGYVNCLRFYLNLAACEDAIDHRRSVAGTLWAITFVCRQSVTNFERKFSEFTFWSWRFVFQVLVSWDDCIIVWWTAPVVRTAAIFVVNWNATVFDVIGFEELNVAVDFNAVLVVEHRLVLKVLRADAFVTFEILRLHALPFSISFPLKLTLCQLFSFVS